MYRGYFNATINKIRTDFEFTKDVCIYSYYSIVQLEKFLNVHIPKWVTGISDGRNIHLIIPKDLQILKGMDYVKIILHEFTHVALSHYSSVVVPFWLNEGIAMYYAQQVEDDFVQDIDSKKLDELTYGESYSLFLKLINIYSLDRLVARIRNVKNFSLDSIFGEDNMKKIMAQCIQEIERGKYEKI